jgi:hypothetical protein
LRQRARRSTHKNPESLVDGSRLGFLGQNLPTKRTYERLCCCHGRACDALQGSPLRPDDGATWQQEGDEPSGLTKCTTMFEPTVHIVDDDPAFLQALSRLLRANGFNVETY